MLEWASENWSDAEVKAFDAAMKGVDDAAISLAVRGLKADYQGANPTDPNLLTGDAGNVGTGGTSYASKAEMTAAMSDPRYATDPAYRKEVERAIERSPNLW